MESSEPEGNSTLVVNIVTALSKSFLLSEQTQTFTPLLIIF